jgi:hypothetical protein
VVGRLRGAHAAGRGGAMLNHIRGRRGRAGNAGPAQHARPVGGSVPHPRYGQSDESRRSNSRHPRRQARGRRRVMST